MGCCMTFYCSRSRNCSGSRSASRRIFRNRPGLRFGSQQLTGMRADKFVGRTRKRRFFPSVNAGDCEPLIADFACDDARLVPSLAHSANKTGKSFSNHILRGCNNRLRFNLPSISQRKIYHHLFSYPSFRLRNYVQNHNCPVKSRIGTRVYGLSHLCFFRDLT